MSKFDCEQSSIFLSSKAFKNITMTNYDNDFTFCAGPAQYHCPSFIAEFLSPLIGRIRSSDPTITQFIISTSDPDGLFHDFLSLGLGLPLCPNSKSVKFLKSLSLELENAELLTFLFNLKGTELTRDNVIDRLTCFMKTGADYTREVEFAASHFSEFEDSVLSSLDFELLSLILSRESIKIRSEDSLYSFIVQRGENDSRFFSLLQFVRFEFLTPESIHNFIEVMSNSFKFFTYSIWNQLRVRLSMSPQVLSSNNRTANLLITIPLEKDSPLDGIIAHLTRQCGGNVHNHKIVTVTTSSNNSETYAGFKAADLQTNSEWLSDYQKNQWFCYNFNNLSVSPTHYSIQSADVTGGSPRNFPKEWVVEGSNDEVTWIELDRRANVTALAGRSKIEVFSISNSGVWRMIRIRQTGPNCCREHYFGFRALEFFGVLSKHRG
jgi:hypothetical protein